MLGPGEGTCVVRKRVTSAGTCHVTTARRRGAKVLVADLDGTLLGGDAADRRVLYAALARHPEVTVVFATGRGLASVRDVLRDPEVPRPRWIIADVGATVVEGADLCPVEPIQTALRAGWPGTAVVREALRGFPALTYQAGVAQDGRCSFQLPPEQLSGELTDTVEALGCTWSYSAGRYFDVLPRNASKGAALTALAESQGWAMESVLVAGDSLNDLTLYQAAARGVIVGNAEPALRAAVPASTWVHRPEQHGAGAILDALAELGWASRGARLVVGYHRPPVQWTREHGWQPPSSPNGILPTLRSIFSAAASLDGIWVTTAVLDTAEHAAHLQGHDTGMPLSFVALSPVEWTGYFHRSCKDTLWPVLMSQPRLMRFEPLEWEHYRTVNERFARHIGDRASPGATVWLHDYNLWLVPGHLHTSRPDLRVGLFHHTPFPTPEMFSSLSVATEIRASLARLDWAGFHTATFAENFRQTMAGEPRSPRIGVHPLGVDRDTIEELVRSRGPRPASTRDPLVLSVERLDYTKAPVLKVDAIGSLLERRPDLRGHLRFRLICPPPERGITAYDTTRTQLERRVDEINREWGQGGWSPIEYLPRAVSFNEVIDNYLAADVFWVTSLQEGMNLTAKEFITTHAAAGLSGVLVVSRNAGVAHELAPAAVLTDPTSPQDLITKLELALALSPEQRRQRLATLADLLQHHQPRDWATQILTAISQAPPARTT